RAAKFLRQTGSVRCARALCCPPRWQLDAVDEVSLRRCDRLNDENHPARLDAKTVRRLVASSHLHTTRHMVFLVGPACDFLARRDQVAKSATPFANGRWVLCNIVFAIHLPRPVWNAKTGLAISI